MLAFSSGAAPVFTGTTRRRDPAGQKDGFAAGRLRQLSTTRSRLQMEKRAEGALVAGGVGGQRCLWRDEPSSSAGTGRAASEGAFH